ncbi:uncharacterized protein LOC121374713 [Gigantopelta aegis]|uniref:uncharacterized protein LOC121374713 n=1 Tax=Gigantopelta aegis TaxID=1735272 RepID=UPI001B88C106|nr:uncharacterized protein LOC121374713 [Gigantopelta aegis]
MASLARPGPMGSVGRQGGISDSLFFGSPSHFFSPNASDAVVRQAGSGGNDDCRVSRQGCHPPGGFGLPGVLLPFVLCPKEKWRVEADSQPQAAECIRGSSFHENGDGAVCPGFTPGWGVEWAASIDLKDAYLHVPIHRDFWKFLRFLFDGKAYEFRVLPFGLATSPHAFTCVVKAVVGRVHLLGIRMHNYLDDWLIPASSQQACLTGVSLVIDMILRLGFIPNWVMSELVPAQVFTYLGVVFNLVEASVRPTDAHLHNFTALAQRLAREQRLWVRTLHESLAALNVRFRRFKRPLQWHLSRVWDGRCWDTLIPVGSWFVQTIQECLVDKCLSQVIPLHPLALELVLFTDASLEGYGAHLGDQHLSGVWSAFERSLHINLLEMEAVRRACLQFWSIIRHRRILLRCDNTAVVAYLNRWGGTKSESLSRRALEIQELCDQWGIVLTAKHTPSSVNDLVDALSRRSPVQTEWMLHKVVAGRILRLWGSPQVDMFATRLNHQLPVFVSPVFVSPVPDTLALEYDALNMDWTGLDLYAFPPPVLLSKVLAKVGMQSCRVTLVAPGWAAQPWFPQLLSLLVQEPVRLPPLPDLLSQRLQQPVWHPKPEVFRLHVWRLSSFPCEAEAFQNEWLNSSPLRSAGQLSEFTNATGALVFVGQVNGILIPYHLLSMT